LDYGLRNGLIGGLCLDYWIIAWIIGLSLGLLDYRLDYWIFAWIIGFSIGLFGLSPAWIIGLFGL
jgi:hypothetical protein